MAVPSRWSFGPFRLDPDNSCLWHGTREISLKPKTFAVLHHLVSHAGRLVTKEELFATVWPDTAIGDAVLKVCIGEIRKVIGDTARASQFIATVHRRGYRFIAPVTAVESTEAHHASSTLSEVPPSSHQPPEIPLRPLLERDLVLHRLQVAFDQARAGVRQVVFVTGEPGIGKTSVVEAFTAQAAADPQLWVAYGQCVEHYGSGEPYMPVLEVLGRLCRGPGGMRLVALLRQQAPTWLVQMPWLLTAADRERLQQELQGATRERMLRELAELVETITADTPLILVLEDLHWSDYATLDLIALLARRRMPARLLIIGTYRPVEVIVHAHPLHAVKQDLQLHGYCMELPLMPLSEAAVAAYLLERFPGHGFPAAMAAWLQQHTDGNPLFLVTMAQALVEQGVLEERGGGWALQGEIEAIAVRVPESLRATIELQMSRLPPEAQRVLEAASVAGMEFSAAAVAAGIDTSVEVVETQCALLARHGQFIRPRSTETWPDGTVTECYGFVHALYHETLYARIPASRCVRWHRQIGARLEAGYGTQVRERAAELSGHFVRGRDTERAVRYLRYAGEQALQRSAYEEASTHFTRGLELLQTLPHTAGHTQEAIDLCLALRMTLHPLGEYERVLAYLRQAEPLATALNDGQRCGRIAAYMASCFRMLGDHKGAIAASQRALPAATNDVALQVVAQHLLGQSYYSMGDFQRAQEFFHKNMALLTGERQFESFGLSYVPAVGALTYMVFCLAHIGEFAEALMHGATSLHLAEQAQHPMSLVFAHRGLCRVHSERGDFQQAIPMLERVIERCRGWHIRDGLPNDLSMLGYAYTLCGRLAEGLPLLEEAVAQSEAIKTRYHQAIRYARLSHGYLLAGRLAEAGVNAQHAFDLACTHGERPTEAWTLLLRGHLAAQSSPPDTAEAEAGYRQALTLADTLGMRPLLAHCHLGIGTLYGRTDCTEQARSELAAALALYRAMEMAWWSSQAETALAHLNGVASARR